MNKNRKGFTIVELVIVIAVIAILAAVLIPTFASLIAKANISADIQLVRNLNTALTAEKAGGENNKTMYDALKMMKNSGYDIDRIVSKSGNNIAWDSVNDRFVLIDPGKDTFIYPTEAGAAAQNVQNAVDYFVISNTIPEKQDQKYSIYLSKDATLAGGTANVSVGFDAGENTGVNVNYTSSNAQTVTIRTNGGTLTVDAKDDTVNHYGAADYSNIIAIRGESFHEFGVSAFVRIVKGHFVAESTAKVIELHVAANDAKITEQTGATVVSYSKGADNVTVKVNDTTKEVTDIKTKDDFENAASNSKVVAEGGVAEINGIRFKDLQSAFNAAKDGDTIKVLDDIDLALTVSVKYVKVTKVTLDMNGKTIANTSDLWEVPNKDAANWSLVSVREGANLTITGNGTFKAKENDCYPVDVQDGATCVIENGTFVGNIDAVYVLEGELTVKGGTYSVVQKFPNASKPYEYVLNCLDANYKNKTAKITVTGGTFDNFNPSNCKAEGDNTNFCPDGYTVISEEKDISGTKHTYYTVVETN